MTHYERGRALEYLVCQYYTDNGWWAHRIAGSHSCVDVIAMRQGEIHLIQCCVNPKGKTKKELDVLKALADENNCRAWFAYRDQGLHIEGVQ